MQARMAVDRMPFDRQRAEVLGRYEQARLDWQTPRMPLEVRR